MLAINAKNGVVRLGPDNGDFFISAPTVEDLDELTKLFLDAWQVTIQDLCPGKSIEKTAHKENGPQESFQHVGLKITRLEAGGIKLAAQKLSKKY